MTKKTYTETLEDIRAFMAEVEEKNQARDKRVHDIACYLEDKRLPVVGVLESQLDHVIQGVGELKGTVETQRREAKRERDEMRVCMSEIKDDISTLRQWSVDHDEKVTPIIQQCIEENKGDIKDLEKEVDNIWRTTKILPVFSGVMGLVGSILGQMGIEIPTK